MNGWKMRILLLEATFVALLLNTATVRSTEHITCIPGTLNVIFAAPHGGWLKPDNWPDRDAGCWTGRGCTWDHKCTPKDTTRCRAIVEKDYRTQNLTRDIRDELYKLSGKYPTIILNNLHRSKLDANRAKPEATFDVTESMVAWEAYQACGDRAREEIDRNYEESRGLFFDIHGHGHPNVWVEIGYLLDSAQLNEGMYTPSMTSIRNLAYRTRIPIRDLISGDQSFGAYIQREGFDAVPSPKFPSPKDRPYYWTGDRFWYDIQRHGSLNGGGVDGIMLESARPQRDNASYAPALARAIYKFLQDYDYNPDNNGSTATAYSCLNIVIFQILCWLMLARL